MSSKRSDRGRHATKHRQPRVAHTVEQKPGGVPVAQPAIARRWLPFWLTLASGLLVWAALPPLGWWPLGWLAPFGWLVLIQLERLPGRRPYWGIYFATFLFWVLTLQGIRLAHWANYFGLVALSGYLGIYVPLSIAVARVACHRWRIPLLVAAPVVWVGFEVARAYGPLGFSLALLGQTQVKQLVMIQVADLFGPYTVSLVIMFAASCALRMLPTKCRGWAWWPVVPLVVSLALVWGYGRYRLAQTLPPSDRAALRVALIQGSIDTVFDSDPQGPWKTLEQYIELTERATDQYQPLDLVVWPETMFPIPDVLVDEGGAPRIEPPLDPQRVDDLQRAYQQIVRNRVRQINEPADEQPDGPNGARRPTSWVFGAAVWQLGDYPARRFNAAELVDPQARIVGRYFKVHPVIFGEYVPFGDVFPALYHFFPLPSGLTPGREPVAWDVNGLRVSPSICFESTMPHLMRWQVAELARRGESPDVLVNLTNDGWFWGSSILDMQLDCAVMRAVELRRPVLVAANTGFSAWIDGNGTVLAKGPRRATETLLAKVVPDGRASWYVFWGDLPALGCTLFCLIAAAYGLARRRSWSRQE